MREFPNRLKITARDEINNGAGEYVTSRIAEDAATWIQEHFKTHPEAQEVAEVVAEYIDGLTSKRRGFIRNKRSGGIPDGQRWAGIPGLELQRLPAAARARLGLKFTRELQSQSSIPVANLAQPQRYGQVVHGPIRFETAIGSPVGHPSIQESTLYSRRQESS